MAVINQPLATLPQAAAVQQAISDYIAELEPQLRKLNLFIHENPELAYEEHKAHDAICDFIEGQGIPVTRHAYGLSTSFEAKSGSRGRTVNFNAEYDALPDIGHACGHNLIATASVAGFVALAHVLKKFGLDGQVQLLGTPAEESGGGKVDLLDAGAFKNVDVSLMMHPMSDASYKEKGVIGSGGMRSIACYDLVCTYRGVSAHAGATPWEGVNALDALVGTYVNVSMLRQQMEPSQRVHGAILEAPKITNAIPAYTKTMYTVRSDTVKSTKDLGQRVRQCMEGAAHGAGCKIDIDETAAYAELRVNDALCGSFQKHMGSLGFSVLQSDEKPMSGSTDQGNVSYAVPALHAMVGIPVDGLANNHTPGFTAATATAVAHERTVASGKAMAMIGWDVLTSDAFYSSVVADFERDKARR